MRGIFITRPSTINAKACYFFPLPLRTVLMETPDHSKMKNLDRVLSTSNFSNIFRRHDVLHSWWEDGVHDIPRYHVSHPSCVNTLQLLEWSEISNHFYFAFASSFVLYLYEFYFKRA